MQRKYIIFLISISLLIAGAITPAPAHPSLPDRTFSTAATIVFENEIKPLIENKFKEDISDEHLAVQRKLLKIELFRYEVIDGRDVYSVHLNFVVRITDKDSGFSHITLRGQEALFIIKGGKIADIIPFDEYVIETDGKEIKKELDFLNHEGYEEHKKMKHT